MLNIFKLINDHSFEFVFIGIQSIPLTRYNICPLVWNVFHEKVVQSLGYLLEIIVPVVIFMLSFGIIYLILSVRNEIFQQRRIDSVKANQKNLILLRIMSTNSTSLANNLVNTNEFLQSQLMSPLSKDETIVVSSLELFLETHPFKKFCENFRSLSRH